MANEKDGKKTMDIARPGKTPPDASARPVVVSHRPMVQDPMVVSADEIVPKEEITAEKPVEAPSHTSKIIQPLNEQPAEEVSKEPAEPQEAVETKQEVAAESAQEETKVPASSEAALVDAVADKVESGNKKKGNGLSEAEKAKQETLQKLITEKKYFVPIGHGHHHRRKHGFLTLLLLLVLIASAGGYLAADAGILDVGIKLPVDLIKT